MHHTIVPLAIGLLIYKVIRSTIAGFASGFGFPFAA